MLLIDDPVKSREEADSETMRNRTWDWYQNDAYTRLMPGGRVIVISTRWHDDDLVGRLLSEQERGGDTWTVLHHPAISTDEKALWPRSQFGLESYCGRSSGSLGLERGKLSTRATPSPDEGVYFERDWFRRRGVVPEKKNLKCYGASRLRRNGRRAATTRCISWSASTTSSECGC